MSTRSTASTIKTVRPKLKRCDRGSRRNKKTGLCVSNIARRDNGLPFLKVDMRPPKVRSRCKKGTRKYKKTGKCEKFPFNVEKINRDHAESLVQRLRNL